MIETGCEPSFLCNRCLRFGSYGSFESCSSVCKTCFENILCSLPRGTPNTIVTIDLVINSSNKEENKQIRLIPKIIHQTWFEELSVERYPEMIRLQNSWRATGWEYRFYDDVAARDFIVEHFSERFVKAYDALIPGAFKADLFRYLVLLIHGGAYADIDLLLETNLETLIPPTTSFVVPRDRPGEILEENFCLWNGFIASSPAHPFLIRVIERSVNLIMNRADLFDFEREICVRSGRRMENWKVRREPGLMLTGPCALGIAVNEAMGERSLKRIELGWLLVPRLAAGKDVDDVDILRGFLGGKPGGGDCLILQLKRNDLGAIRISDNERDVIVASTELPGMPKFPSVQSNTENMELYVLEEEKSTLRRKEKPHYHMAGDGQWVWGSKMVYVDDMVNSETIAFEIKNKIEK